MTETLYTVPETAERLTVSESTVWRLIRDGRLQVVRIGRSTRVKATEIDQFVGDGDLDIERTGLEGIREQLRTLGFSGTDLVAQADLAVQLAVYGATAPQVAAFLKIIATGRVTPDEIARLEHRA